MLFSMFAGIMKLAGNLEGGCDSICAFCSRMKRGRIYKCARDNGYNVLALGQHLDDLAERSVTYQHDWLITVFS